MKKFIIFIVLFIIKINLSIASNLEVKTNIPSWEFDSPIEINLIANEKNAKIFYYTDWEWRMDNIKEYKTPILIKEDTNIDFYASNKNFEDTLIQSASYTFKYSNNIEIKEKNAKIIIENNSWDVQNIWYWIIKADNLDYEILPNTYIENKKYYEIDYKLTKNENIAFISPDWKIKKKFTFKNVIINNINNKLQEKNIWNNSWSIIINSWTEITGIKSNTWNLEVNKTNQIENNNLDLNSQLKTSVIESNNNNEKKQNNLYYIFWILAIVIMYNIWLFLKDKYKSSKKN